MHIAWINSDNGTPLCIVLALHTASEPDSTEKQPTTETVAAARTETVAAAGPQVAPATAATHPLSSALENTTTALILLSQDTIILACNTAFETLSGYTRQEIEGQKSWMDFVVKEDQPRLKRYYLLRRLDPASSPNTYEFKFAGRDGQTRDVLINISPVPGSRHLAATLLDLAEYKQAAAEVQSQEQPAPAQDIQPSSEASDVTAADAYRYVLELSPNAIIVTGMNGIISYASDKALKLIWHGEAESITGKHLRSFVRPGALEELNDILHELNKTGQMAETSIDMMRQDGHILNCRISASVLTEPNGQAYIAFCLHDITKQKEQYEKLVEEERSYRWMAENGTDSMWLMDLNLNIIWSNHVLGRMRGYTAEEALSLPLELHLLPDSFSRVMDFYNNWIRDFKAASPGLPQKHNMELQFFRKDGSVMSAECFFTLIKDERGQAAGLLGIAHDISDRKLAEEQAARSLAQLDKTLHGAIAAMIRIVEMRDPYTSGHQDRVASLAGAIAREMSLPDDLIKGIEITARIHDIGKVYIPMEILSKPGTFTDVERQIIQSHAQGSYDILKSIDFPWPVAEAAYQHHERLDGSGYPRGLKENEIILEAKILMVADVVEAMASHRPYRPSCGIDAALNEISAKSGLLYDSNIVEHCVRIFQEGRFSFNGTYSEV
jgi:PAS domain S-box-containing protein